MRKAMLLLTLALGLVALMAQMSPLHLVGEGHFAGKAAVHSEPGLLAMVYFNNPGAYPAVSGCIVYRFSTDGGDSWTSVNVAQASNCLTRPTLFYSPEEIIITYNSGTDRLLAKSVDGGLTWLTVTDDPSLETGRTFENSPITERRGGQLKTVDLLLPYPEHAQEGVFLWIDTGVDTNALALEAKNDGWLAAPGSLFSPKQGASSMMRFNVSRTTPEFMKWLGGYLEKHK